MDSLVDRITSLKCAHDRNYSSMCIEIICNHKSRMMCIKCLSGRNAHKIDQLFGFLNEQLVKDEMRIYKCRAIIWQQFKQSQLRITQILNELEVQLETYLQSITGQVTISKLKKQFLYREIQLADLEALGQLLSREINLNIQGQYYLKENKLAEQEAYIQSKNICNVQDQLIFILKNSMNSTTVKQFNAQKLEAEYIKCMKNTRYQIKQRIAMNSNFCNLFFNHDETEFVVVSGCKIKFFHLSNGTWLYNNQKQINYTSFLGQVQFNHDSTQLATSSLDSDIVLWKKLEIGQWDIDYKIRDHTSMVFSIQFNKQSTLLASCSADTILIHINDQGRWVISQCLKEHTRIICKICFNNKSTLLASGSEDGTLIVWEFNKQSKWVIKQKSVGETKYYGSIQFSQDSTKLLTGSSNNTIKIWIIDKSKTLNCFQTLSGHTDNIIGVCYNNQSNMIVSCSCDKTIKIWRLSSESNWLCTQNIKSNTIYCNSVIISSDSTTMISGSNNEIIVYITNNDQNEPE